MTTTINIIYGGGNGPSNDIAAALNTLWDMGDAATPPGKPVDTHFALLATDDFASSTVRRTLVEWLQSQGLTLIFIDGFNSIGHQGLEGIAIQNLDLRDAALGAGDPNAGFQNWLEQLNTSGITARFLPVMHNPNQVIEADAWTNAVSEMATKGGYEVLVLNSQLLPLTWQDPAPVAPAPVPAGIPGMAAPTPAPAAPAAPQPAPAVPQDTLVDVGALPPLGAAPTPAPAAPAAAAVPQPASAAVPTAPAEPVAAAPEASFTFPTDEELSALTSADLRKLVKLGMEAGLVDQPADMRSKDKMSEAIRRGRDGANYVEVVAPASEQIPAAIPAPAAAPAEAPQPESAEIPAPVTPAPTPNLRPHPESDNRTGDQAVLDNLWWNMTSHAMTPEAVEKVEVLRDQFKHLGETIIHSAPTSRERALALTHLEESLMWAVASIARNNAKN